MSLHARLENILGTSMAGICDGVFHTTSANHCAHFVSHMVGLDFSFDCKSFKGGNGTPANVRVHEVFARCPKVGPWSQADKTRDHLVFVTKEANVTVGTKTMINIPQKHIGIFSNGMIYHYSNTNNQVVKQTPDTFFATFQSIYAGHQGLFFGTIPGSDLNLDIDPTAETVVNGFKFTLLKSDTTWHAFAKDDTDQKYYVGRETNNGNYVGLFMPTDQYYGPQYRAADYADTYDHWAQLLELTGYGESKNFFNVINTYDSAKFTFGFYQLAAHTANDNLILFFREILKLDDGKNYFPELTLIDGRVHRINQDGGVTDLEEEMPTGPNGRRQLQLFMNYMNAKLREHDIQEVLQSARLIHWSNTKTDLQAVQVRVAFDILQKKMATRYSRWYDLDGQSDVICALIADIHHQGRAKRQKVADILTGGGNVVDRLININSGYTGRINDLNDKLPAMQAAGQLGTHVYDAALNEFQPR